MTGKAGLKTCPTAAEGRTGLRTRPAAVSATMLSIVGRALGAQPALTVAIAAALATMAGCAPTVKYTRPATEVAPAFKENANWKAPQPSDTELRGNWWELFGDARLNDLEQQIDISNENLKAAEAQFSRARAVVRATRSNLFPTVTRRSVDRSHAPVDESCDRLDPWQLRRFSAAGRRVVRS